MTPSADPWIVTPRLLLRKPRAGDLEDYVRLHTDARTYAHAPGTMPDPTRCGERLEHDLAAWEADGVGYAPVVDRGSGRTVGWAGVRVEREQGREHLNLYYRLAHTHLGRGLGREAVRAVVAWALEHRPDLALRAVVDRGNEASLATARTAGLADVGWTAPASGGRTDPMRLLEAPRVQVVEAAAAAVDDVVDLWTRVNDSGGAVGFRPGARRTDVAGALGRHLEAVAAGEALLVELRDPDGGLRGLALWHHTGRFPFEHVAFLQRLMVDPRARGRNLGRLLLAAMVGVARRELPGVELLRLDYRSGLGLGDFYAAQGWAEVGRVPSGLRMAEGDHRDEVIMVRRVDGGPLAADGRT